MPTAIRIKGLFKDEVDDGGEKPSSNTAVKTEEVLDNSKKTAASGDIASDPTTTSTATPKPGIAISESLPDDDLGVQGEWCYYKT